MGAATGYEGDNPERAGSKQEQMPMYSQMSDVDLMMLIQVNRDRKAWGELYGRYSTIIEKRLSKMKQYLNIDEVTQEVLIKIYVKCKTFDPARSFLPYILTITRNTSGG